MAGLQMLQTRLLRSKTPVIGSWLINAGNESSFAYYLAKNLRNGSRSAHIGTPNA